ncbi:MAG: efflux RND transporter periplasmic adaptor subunit [Gammaproteobacteria bacterium]|nr:efflux transporter periplasmic adaptor subunit [Chromatiales bacterium]MDP6674131.1 efflux RND transporter periplasmic adaptor subunit [Gammaproteobacteria bacterium]
MNTKRVRILLLLAVVIVAIAVAWQLAGRSQPVRIGVIAVERGEVMSIVSNTRAGTVDACRRAGMSPSLGGQIAELPVRKGDAVKTGQIMLELWNEDLRAELELARRDVVASRGRMDEVCVRANVAIDEAKRLTSLLARGLAAEEETDRAVGESRARQAGCAAARDAIKVSEAQVDVATARLERTLLRAPFDGVIAEINGELGEFVTPSPVGIPTPPTVDLIDASCLYISAPIDEVDAPAVQAGQQASISMDAFPGRKFPGFVRRVAPYVLDREKQARTVEVEAEISNLNGVNTDGQVLLPGYSADVEIILATRENVLRVPTQVILDGTRVFVLDGTLLAEREIETGISSWEFVEVLSGLDEGELVVLTVDREGVVEGATAVVE